MSALVRTANGAFAHPDDPGEPGYGEKRVRWSVTPRESEILRGLARGRRVLEIGTGLGVSTARMAQFAERVDTVDVDPWVLQTIAPGLPDNVSFYLGSDAVPRDARYSMVFIDGLHQKDAVAADIRFALAHLERPGLIVLHDGRMPHVQVGIEASRIDTSIAFPLPTEAGLVVIFVGDR